MKSVILIPARFASSRYPGKPLVGLKGCTNCEKPLIQRSYEAAMRVPGIAAVHVITDDDRIAEAVPASASTAVAAAMPTTPCDAAT